MIIDLDRIRYSGALAFMILPGWEQSPFSSCLFDSEIYAFSRLIFWVENFYA